MAMLSTRVLEANRLVANGHKYLKTNLLRWKPDYDNAANQFNQAAMIYKGAGLHKQAIEANELAVKAYIECAGAAFQAAKCLEQAALSAKELGDWQTVSRYYNQAIDMYRENGSPDTAVSVMERAAKALTDVMPSVAADLYIQASEACVLEDRQRQAAEYCSKAATLYVKLKDFQRAATIGREEYNCYAQLNDHRSCSRIAVGLVLIHIANKNIVGVREVLGSCQIDDDANYLVDQLVKGFEKRDGVIMSSVLKNFYFRNLNTEYAKLANFLSSSYESDQKPTEKGETAQQDDEDDDIT